MCRVQLYMYQVARSLAYIHQVPPPPKTCDPCPPPQGSRFREGFQLYATLQVTRGQILSQSPKDATRFWWHLRRS